MTHQIGENTLITINLVDKDKNAVDLTNKDVHTWVVENPNGISFTLTGAEITIDADPTSGIVYCRADLINWSIAGWYKITVGILFTDTFQYYSDTQLHQVIEVNE